MAVFCEQHGFWAGSVPKFGFRPIQKGWKYNSNKLKIITQIRQSRILKKELKLIIILSSSWRTDHVPSLDFLGQNSLGAPIFVRYGRVVSESWLEMLDWLGQFGFLTRNSDEIQWTDVKFGMYAKSCVIWAKLLCVELRIGLCFRDRFDWSELFSATWESPTRTVTRSTKFISYSKNHV